MTQYILLALIAINCVLIGINWRLRKQLTELIRVWSEVRVVDPIPLYVCDINVSDQFIGKGQPVRR